MKPIEPEARLEANPHVILRINSKETNPYGAFQCVMQLYCCAAACLSNANVTVGAVPINGTAGLFKTMRCVIQLLHNSMHCTMQLFYY